MTYRHAARTAFALTLLALQACVIVPVGHQPHRGHVPPEVVSAIKAEAGKKTRADILLTLGPPERRFDEDRVFGYKWSETVAEVIVFSYYSAGGFDVDEQRMLLIEFDAQGKVLRLDVVAAILDKRLDDAVQAWIAGQLEPKR